MLTPEAICKLVEDDLQTKVNYELRTNCKSLYAGNTIILYFDSEKEQEWVCDHLSGFTIERKRDIYCSKHEHGALCFNEADDDDSDEEETGTDDQTGKPVFCAHANGTCLCSKFLIYVKL